MNERFYLLPVERQEKIINAAFKVFSENSYKKSPMLEIADAANISKSLLFHYFINKKELYCFLLEKAAKITIESLRQDGCYEKNDFFTVMEMALESKVKIMKNYPNLSNFMIKAYYEKDPEVVEEVIRFTAKYANFKSNIVLNNIDYSSIKPNIDIKMMYQEMYYACEGFLYEKMKVNGFDVDLIVREFKKLFTFWRGIYQKEEE